MGQEEARKEPALLSLALLRCPRPGGGPGEPGAHPRRDRAADAQVIPGVLRVARETGRGKEGKTSQQI